MNWRDFGLVVLVLIFARSSSLGGEVEDALAALRASVTLDVRGVCLDYSHYTLANVDVREVAIEGRVSDRKLIQRCADVLLKEYGHSDHEPFVRLSEIFLELTFTRPDGGKQVVVLQGPNEVMYGRLRVMSSHRIVSSEILELLRKKPGIKTKEIKR